LVEWQSAVEELAVKNGFWRGRRVFISGHTGFKGSWLSFWLTELGAEVTGFALPPDTEPSLFDLLGIQSRTVSRCGDVRDFAGFQTAVLTANPEVFFHLAAQAQVREGYSHPKETIETNVSGTLHALEIGRHVADLRAMVVVTSDKCYRNDNRVTGYREEDPLGGDDPYSCSKACAEMLAESYNKSFFQTTKCAVATARAGNVIGGGDWSRDRLVPDIIRALAGHTTLALRNSGATRPWQHVLDPLNGYITLAQRLCAEGQRFAGAWNFGPLLTDAVTVEELARSMYGAWGAEPRLERDMGPNPREAQRLAVDATKARENLGWTPRLSSAEMIQWTVEWYKRWRSGKAVAEITAEQIDRYQERSVVRRALSAAQR